MWVRQRVCYSYKMKPLKLLLNRFFCVATLTTYFLSPAWALNKCVDAQGKVTFTDTSCVASSKAAVAVAKPASGGNAVDDVVIASSEAASRGDFEGMRRTSVKTDEFDKVPPGKQRDQLLALLKYAAPVQVAVVSRDISADGQSATVKATGKYRNMATELLEPTKGIIQLERSNGSWKVAKSEWGPNKW
jgi:hypothetical protein